MAKLSKHELSNCLPSPPPLPSLSFSPSLSDLFLTLGYSFQNNYDERIPKRNLSIVRKASLCQREDRSKHQREQLDLPQSVLQVCYKHLFL